MARVSSAMLASEAEQLALRSEVEDWCERTGLSLTDFGYVCGYSFAARGRVNSVMYGDVRLTLKLVERWRQALQKYPQGWPADNPPQCIVQKQEERRAYDRQRRDMERKLRDRTRGRFASGPSDRISLSESEIFRRRHETEMAHAAREHYWLSQEKPGLNGQRMRCTPLSRQVA